jgi:quercetin dioxygenase-like cupin family protein
MAEFITPGTVRDRSTVTPIQLSAGVECYEIVPAGTYAEALFAQQYELQNSSFELVADTNDRYLYILDGEGEFSFADHNNPLKEISVKEVSVKEGSAAMMLAGESGKLSTTSALSVVVIYVPGPATPWAKRLAKDVDIAKRVVLTRLGAADKQAASSDREFEVLFDKNQASRGATMFVGFIPTSGAPEHYHLYDEICMIVNGNGGLQTGDHPLQELKKGSAFHVAPRYLHAIHNPHPADVWILGVFRPEGSPSAAYYPDGRSAPNNLED